MTIEEEVRQTIERKSHCYFISPHLDDAFLSAGDLISYLAKHTKVTIITIFTEPSPMPYTLAARSYLRYCGLEDADQLFNIRKEEDRKVCKIANVETVHLGFIDGTWRRKRKPMYLSRMIGKKVPEAVHLYPLGRKIIKLAREDKLLKQEIADSLDNTIMCENSAIFCPLGTVKHMDHTITQQVCTKLFQNIIYWTDFPYIKRGNRKNRLASKLRLQQSVWNKNMELKKRLIGEYKTQLSSLFPDGKINLTPEVYFL